MTKLKEQAVEILNELPDDKVITVIEILKGLRALYSQSEKPAAYDGTAANVMGIFSNYANSDLIPLEKEAWGEAVKEKHAAH